MVLDNSLAAPLVKVERFFCDQIPVKFKKFSNSHKRKRERAKERKENKKKRSL
jgi:hypothetical protein